MKFITHIFIAIVALCSCSKSKGINELVEDKLHDKLFTATLDSILLFEGVSRIDRVFNIYVGDSTIVTEGQKNTLQSHIKYRNKDIILKNLVKNWYKRENVTVKSKGTYKITTDKSHSIDLAIYFSKIEVVEDKATFIVDYSCGQHCGQLLVVWCKRLNTNWKIIEIESLAVS